MAPTLAQQIGVEQTKPGEYVSKLPPLRMGNSAPVAYGGCTIAVAVGAAYASLNAPMALYSVLGHFLGPASLGGKLICRVHAIRDTRTFATRRVQVHQTQPDGTLRACLELTADFHKAEPARLTYSALPSSSYPNPEDCPTTSDHVRAIVQRGDAIESNAVDFANMFGISDEFFETRVCTNGVSGQNLWGVAKNAITQQDHRHITAKTSAEWERVKEPLGSTQQNMAALAFLMDGGLSFLPMTHGHLWFDDVSACATLDFALRIFTADIQLETWHLRERTTSRGGGGRTYSEGRLWDRDGNLVASMTQQSIFRPRKDSLKSAL